MSYSPVLGRFIQRDPLGYVDGASLYEYVRSRPVTLTDSSGLAAEFNAGLFIGDLWRRREEIKKSWCAIRWDELAADMMEVIEVYGLPVGGMRGPIQRIKPPVNVPRPKGIREAFKKPADAIGDVNGEAKLVGKGATKNDFWKQKGFSETEYYVDSNGTKWTVFKNPKTGEYSGAHPSSGQ